jgi:putative membrane protein
MDSQSGSSDPTRRTWLAQERTWLAWWRTGLTTVVAAIGVGRVAPELLPGAAWPYAALGAGYALIALAVFIGGMIRHRRSSDALAEGRFEPLPGVWVEALTAAGSVLTLATLALILF